MGLSTIILQFWVLCLSKCIQFYNSNFKRSLKDAICWTVCTGGHVKTCQQINIKTCWIVLFPTCGSYLHPPTAVEEASQSAAERDVLPMDCSGFNPYHNPNEVKRFNIKRSQLLMDEVELGCGNFGSVKKGVLKTDSWALKHYKT